MQVSKLNLSGPRMGNSFARKVRALLAEMYYALELSNRAYYQGRGRF